MVTLHSIMLAGKYSSSLPDSSLTRALVKVGSSSTHSKLMRRFDLRRSLVLVLLRYPVVGCLYVPATITDGCYECTYMYVIATEMFWGRTDSNFNVRSPSFQLLWNYDTVTVDHAMSG